MEFCVETQNREKMVFVLPFVFFPQTVGGHNSQTGGLRLSMIQ